MIYRTYRAPLEARIKPRRHHLQKTAPYFVEGARTINGRSTTFPYRPTAPEGILLHPPYVTKDTEREVGPPLVPTTKSTMVHTWNRIRPGRTYLSYQRSTSIAEKHVSVICFSVISSVPMPCLRRKHADSIEDPYEPPYSIMFHVGQLLSFSYSSMEVCSISKRS